MAFGRFLGANGVEAPVSSVSSFARALQVAGIAHPERVFWAGHSCFVTNPEEMPLYAEAFVSFFSGARVQGLERAVLPELSVLADEEDGLGEGPSQEEAPGVRLALYSRAELLREKDFGTCTAEELQEISRLMSLMRRSVPRRRSRRMVPVRHIRGTPDLRRTVRRALRSGGEPVRLERQGPGLRDRPVALLVDVSGSMEPYARAFLRFAHAAVAGRRRVEAFTLGTRLTRVTRELSWRDPDAALRRASHSVSDFSGGTRLGEGIKSFNDRFGVTGMARGAVVVILSDGWDRGDPGQIASEMERLSRVAFRVLWVNPLKASPGYAPLARGMAAALPFVDEFLEGHSLRSLEELAGAIAG